MIKLLERSREEEEPEKYRLRILEESLKGQKGDTFRTGERGGWKGIWGMSFCVHCNAMKCYESKITLLCYT